MKKFVKGFISIGMTIGMTLGPIGLIFAQDITAATLGNPKMVSINELGIQAEKGSIKPSISADGNLVVFESESSNLVKGDNNNATDIFVKNISTDSIMIVSTSKKGSIAKGFSSNAVISSNGRYVAFESTAANLVSNDTNGTYSDIFLKDLTTGDIQLISKTSSGNQVLAASSLPSISTDGLYVTFQANGSLIEGIETMGNHLYIYNCLTGATEMVDVSETGEIANLAGNYRPNISGDGRYVIFESESTNLVPNDNNYSTDIFVRDCLENKTVRVNISSEGAPSTASCYSPSISADGRYVEFQSIANNLVADNATDYNTDIFIHDRDTDGNGVFDETNRISTIKASVSTTGQIGSSGSVDGYISANGQYVVFSSSASNLVDSDTNSKTDIFVHNISNGVTTRVNLSVYNVEANNHSYYPVISADGQCVAFASTASNLTDSDTNGDLADIFVYQR
ncbi:MAG: domain protein beta Propeller [Bacillales bacterium]|nr:domain protein beta Propeller [Bacillales bacterium]